MEFPQVLILFIVVYPVLCSGQGKKVVCYVGTWATYRPGDGKFDVEDIDASLCTHAVYAFAGLDANTNQITSLDSWQDLCTGGGKCGFQRFTGLKKKFPKLKTLLAIGGWNEGSLKYSEMASKKQSRKVFIDSCVKFLKTYDFDGMDIDWEYPTQRGGNSQDKDNFVFLMQEMRKAFDKDNMLLSAALPAGKDIIDSGYKAADIFKYIHFGSVMAYDYHGSWDRYVHHHAPINKHPKDKQDNIYKNIIYTIEYWLSLGAPAEKLLLGIPTYGHTYTLTNAKDTDVYARTITGGQAGPYTRQSGILGYNEMCEMWMKHEEDWEFVRDPHLDVPYAIYNYEGGKINRNQWVGYDDQTSVHKKCDLIEKYGLGGAMVWSLETDDFHGKCQNGKYPLVKTIKDRMSGGSPPPETTTSTSSSTVTTPPTTTPSPNPHTTTTTTAAAATTTTSSLPEGVCKQEGLNSDPEDCHIFYQCWKNTEGTWESQTFQCPSGLAFNPDNNVCDWPQNVPGCD